MDRSPHHLQPFYNSEIAEVMAGSDLPILVKILIPLTQPMEGSYNETGR